VNVALIRHDLIAHKVIEACSTYEFAAAGSGGAEQ
jgi:hypothetical protein